MCSSVQYIWLILLCSILHQECFIKIKHAIIRWLWTLISYDSNIMKIFLIICLLEQLWVLICSMINFPFFDLPYYFDYFILKNIPTKLEPKRTAPCCAHLGLFLWKCCFWPHQSLCKNTNWEFSATHLRILDVALSRLGIALYSIFLEHASPRLSQVSLSQGVCHSRIRTSIAVNWQLVSIPGIQIIYSFHPGLRRSPTTFNLLKLYSTKPRMDTALFFKKVPVLHSTVSNPFV